MLSARRSPRRSSPWAGQQRVYRQRIRSTQSLKKIFRAMELIAASRIGKARDRVAAAGPYSRAITRAISAVSAHSDVEHPLTSDRTDTKQVAMLVITADRGMAGAYTANAIREAERLREQLEEEGKEMVQYAAGRRGVAYFTFRRRELAAHWTGDSDAPSHAVANEIAAELLRAFLAPADEGGVVRTPHRLHALHLDGEPGAAGHPHASPRDRRGSGRSRRGSICRCTSSSRAPRRSSTRCSLATSSPGSTTACSRHPLLSLPTASAR